MAILDRVRRLNRAYLNPMIRRIAGRVPGPLVLLRHRGRASGRLYVTPLIAQQTANSFVIPLTYGERADWVKNVLDAGKAEVRHGAATCAVINPVVLNEHAALPLLAPSLRQAVQVVGIKRFLKLAAVQSPTALSA